MQAKGQEEGLEQEEEAGLPAEVHATDFAHTPRNAIKSVDTLYTLRREDGRDVVRHHRGVRRAEHL
jgi:hypothetical protein